MNVSNIKQGIVSNVLKAATSALKNAGRWRRNNNDHPLSMTTAQQVGLSEPSLLCGATQSIMDARNEVIKTVEDSKVDLIVMGSHGKSALGAALLGSVTIGVIHREAKTSKASPSEIKSFAGCFTRRKTASSSSWR